MKKKIIIITVVVITLIAAGIFAVCSYNRDKPIDSDYENRDVSVQSEVSIQNIESDTSESEIEVSDIVIEIPKNETSTEISDNTVSEEISENSEPIIVDHIEESETKQTPEQNDEATVVNPDEPEYSPSIGNDNPFDNDAEIEIDDTSVEDYIGEGEDRPGEGIKF